MKSYIFLVNIMRASVQINYLHGELYRMLQIWNEHDWDAEYVKLLRRRLDSSGLANVKILLADLAGDNPWSPAANLLLDSQLSNAVYALGYSLLCDYQAPLPTGHSLVENDIFEEQFTLKAFYFPSPLLELISRVNSYISSILFSSDVHFIKLNCFNEYACRAKPRVIHIRYRKYLRIMNDLICYSTPFAHM